MSSDEVRMSSAEQYDEQYYERGVRAGVSGYTDYRWRPEYVLPLANELKKRFLRGGKHEYVLDYGCAKGFLVKAFRLLGVLAWGVDVSRYAIEHCDPAVNGLVFCRGSYPPVLIYDLVIAKDTLEHVSRDEIDGVLKSLRGATEDAGHCVVIVPLGDNGLYRIREYELDKTHVIREDEVWWIERFNKAGFVVSEFHYDFPHAKDHWLRVHPQGNATFVLKPAG